MGTLLFIIQLISVFWFFTHTEEFIEELNLILKRFKNIFKIPLKIIGCIRCLSFWGTLIYTQDFVFACQVSLIAFIIDKYVLSTPIKLK